jgi:hypothetical protein
MTDDQKKKPTAGFWITVGLTVLLDYPLNFASVFHIGGGRGKERETAASWASLRFLLLA